MVRHDSLGFLHRFFSLSLSLSRIVHCDIKSIETIKSSDFPSLSISLEEEEEEEEARGIFACEKSKLAT